MWERMPKPLYPIYLLCFHPLLILIVIHLPSQGTLPKSAVLCILTQRTPPSSTPSPSLIGRALCCGRGELSLSLMFGRRRRAWCRRQAGHWWRLAPPYEGLYHQYYYFFLLPPLLSYLHVSDKRGLWWVPASICVLFQFLFLLVSRFVSQAFSHRQRDLFLIQAPVFLSKKNTIILLWSLSSNSWTNNSL